MAGIDYVSCRKCGKRLFYDGEHLAREYMYQYVGTAAIVCDHCAKRMEKQIEKYKKALRR